MAFQGFLKEDTATTLRLGPFVDKTDGVTYEVAMATAMNNATTGVRISKNGAALAARTTATEPVYDAFGYYLVNLDATDVGASGRLKVIFGDAAVCLPCEADFEIIPADLFDTLLVAQPAAAILKFFNKATPTGTVNSLPDAVAGAAGGVSIVGSEMAVAAASKTGYAIGVGGIGATAFAASAIDAAALAADAVDEIIDEVVEGTTTLRQATRLNLSALTGKSSGGGTATPIFRDIGDTKPRITATVDADGNRTAVTRDGTQEILWDGLKNLSIVSDGGWFI